MKMLLTIFVCILLCMEGLPQSCLPEGITFTTQSQIDNFKANYPNCKEIEGDVLISGGDIINFYGLNEISAIRGNLVIQGNAILSGLYGFQVYRIYGSLSIENNNSLLTLSGLENLFRIEGSLKVSNNPSLVSLKGLVNLTVILGELCIDSNQLLFNLDALSKLTFIGNSNETGSIIIHDNTSLTSLIGLGNINPASINGIIIYDNPWLSDCDVASICAYLAIPGGVIEIHDNHTGCNSQEEIEEDCLDNCLPEGMIIFYQEEIDSILILYPDCKEIMGRIFIEDANYGYIENLYGFSNIKSIDGYLVIGHAPELTSLSGLDNLSILGGSLYLDSIDSLADLNNLTNLKKIYGGLQLDNLGKITSLSGLENLNYIGNHIIIQFNGMLADLSALENITSINSWLDIWGNPSLQSLAGLDNIEANSISSIYIKDNPLLSECEVASICNFLLIPGKQATIENNATGCNNAAEIIDKCEVEIDEDFPKEILFNIYPNPATTTIHVEITVPGVELSIYNTAGQRCIQTHLAQSNSMIELRNLPPGLYFITLAGDSFIKACKLVKY